MGRPTTPAKKSSPGGVSKVISKSTAQSDNFLLETIHKHFAPYFWPNACLKRGYKLDDEHSTPCTLPECVQARPLLEHIRACQKPNCSFPDCILTKTCLDHFDLQQACCIFYLGNPKFKSCTARINEIHKFIIKSVRSENCLLAKRTCFDSQCAEMKSLITHYGQCQMKSECEFPLCTFRDHTDQHMTQNGQQCCVNYMSGVNFDICITKKLSEAPEARKSSVKPCSSDAKHSTSESLPEAQKSILTPDLSQHLLAQQSCAMPFSSKTTVEKTIELLKLKSAVESQLVSGIFPTIFGNKPAIMEQIWMLFLNFYQQMTETDPVKFDQHNKKEAQRQKLLSEELETKQANLNAQIEVNHISVPQLKSSTQQAQERLLFMKLKDLKN
ncbi:hypothetical protein L596_000938 [Steinernema carpocapsae]|uniref:Uncharacterized protein n=1 Tax=Steinernema carpocapsae TaxID=34508 RepID=A0A4U8UNT0_STECR|nr:hypothetical protein L596_000938 [Steinernema carpocapsae]